MGCFGTYCSGVLRFGSHGRNVGARTERHGSAVQAGNVMVRLDWAGIAEAALDCQGGEVRDGKGSRGLISRVSVWLGLAVMGRLGMAWQHRVGFGMMRQYRI